MDFGLHDISIYEMKNEDGEVGKYFEKENVEHFAYFAYCAHFAIFAAFSQLPHFANLAYSNIMYF